MRNKYIPILEEGGFSDNFYSTLNNYINSMGRPQENYQYIQNEDNMDTEKEDNDYDTIISDLSTKIEDLEKRLFDIQGIKQSIPEDPSMELIRLALNNDEENMIDDEYLNSDNYSEKNVNLGKYKNDPNIGEKGKQIITDFSNYLGYTPNFNSVYRSKEKNDALIKSGAPAVKNSWHLTGDAVDLSPSDWSKLSADSKKSIKNKYDVVFHNNHYHIEPKGKR